MSVFMETFAKALVQSVRDMAIVHSESVLDSRRRDVKSSYWRSLIDGDGSREDLVRKMVPEIVDEAIGALLYSIDQEVLYLMFKDKDGEVTDLVSEGEGELTGYYFGSGGWLALYSQKHVTKYETGVIKSSSNPDA